MKTVIKYALYALQTEEIMVTGNYGSDYQPITECRDTMRFVKEYDSQSQASIGMEENSYLSDRFTILPVYVFLK